MTRQGTKMSDKITPDWDPRSPSVLGDQRNAYDEMRERCPVAYSEFLNWSLFGHEDIAEVLANPDVYSSVSKHRAVPNGMDAPEHTRYRAVLEPFFAPERMDAFEADCRTVAIDLIQALPTNQDLEFSGSFALPFALKTNCAFLGWPVDIWQQINVWTHGNQEAALSQNRKSGAALAQQFTGIVEHELAIRRNAATPAGNDITTHLLETEVDGERLSDDDIVSILRNWTAGQGTVSAGIEILTLYLIEHPDMQATLRNKPELIPAAIEEILRADGPLVANRRTTTQAVDIGGRSIAAGEKLTLMWIAANRDSRVFDEPAEVRLDRDQSANYLFGAGIHDCLGAPFALLEMRVALEELLSRTKAIEPGRDSVHKRASYPGNGLASLPVQFTS
jgi:cytochrome P450